MPHLLERLPGGVLSAALDDPARQRAVERARLLDRAQAAQRSRRWAQRAARALRAPVAAVTFLDGAEQVFDAVLGLPGTEAGRRAPRETSVCQFVVAHGDAIAVRDARRHAALARSPFVGELALRAYLGAPIAVDGHAIGALCVAEPEPRAWADEDVARIVELSDGLSAELGLALAHEDLRRRDALLRATLEELQAMRDAAAVAGLQLERPLGASASAASAVPAPPTGPSTAETSAEAARRAHLESKLRTVLEQGGLHVVAQPIVRCEDGALHAVEALLRWTDPELGSVSPAEFVPLAEQIGVIDAIGRWVLREACRAVADLERGSGTVVRCGVNVSPRQLLHPSFATAVADALAEHGLGAERLVLEITETALLGSDPATNRTLCALQALGVSLVLDDFGTGFSSLSMLKDRPIDGIKVDRSFVGGLPGDATSAAIVSGVLGMARALGRTVTAEGIETAEQLAHLRELGCDFAQGYLLGRPAPFADAARVRRPTG